MSLTWRLAALLFILVALLPLPGCEPVAATSPFYTEDDIVFDDALIGRWIVYGDNQPSQYDEHETADAPIKMTLDESLDRKRTYRLVLETIGSGNKMDAVLFQLGGERFLDITPSPRESEHVFLPNILHTHTLLRIKQRDDVLFAAYLNKDWVKSEVPEDRRHLQGFWDENPVLLLPTPELQKLLLKAVKTRNAFYREFRFSRKDSESSSRDLADYGYRLMAQEFVRRGDYESALNAIQQALHARPDNHGTYLLLAFMQAANSDGAGARKSVSEWIRRCRQVLKGGFGSGECLAVLDESPENEDADLDVVEHQLLGISYFAEENWKEAEREFEAAMRTTAKAPGQTDGDMILFRSLTLMQLGKKLEAAALLDHNREVLGKQGTIVADYLLGKVKETDLLPQMKANQESFVKDQCNTECRTDFFIASRYLAEGDRDKAREWFQKTLEVREFADLPPAIARLRLKQLERK